MMVVVVSGLPGVGKSTIARRVASELGACWLEIDVLEAPFLERFDGDAIGWAGYEALTGLAGAQLSVGMSVVLDSVAWTESLRSGWRSLAAAHAAAFAPVEVVCSDPAEHRRRVEARHAKRSWDDIERARSDWWEPWTGDRLTVDTIRLIDDVAADVVSFVADLR